MLRELRIKNFAIIDNLSVEFQPGLNVLTGETGAGKSILMNALNLLLGGRADTDYIRTGESSATVEGVFQLDDPELLERLREFDIEPEEGEIVVKRRVTDSGKSRCSVNESVLTVGALGKIGDHLVDIHGQHDHQALLRAETHLDLLDRYGKLLQERKRFAREFSAYQDLIRQLEALRSQEQTRKEREELLRFQLKEINEAELDPEEEDSLKNERNKLRHVGKLRESLEAALLVLAEADGSVQEGLGRARRDLESLVSLDADLEPAAERARTACYEVEELIEELRSHLNATHFDPARLEEIEDRLAEINGLKRKYGVDVPAILERGEEIARELSSLENSETAMAELRQALGAKEAELGKLAVDLAKKRETAARELKAKVERELKDLNMKQVQFGIRFDYPDDAEGFIEFNQRKVRPHPGGIGAMEFLFSPNPGESLRPLAKIASGGELSRVMLALKSILHDQDPIPIMVFDEVDTGIGGKTAEMVGKKLKKVSGKKQVFCITHLPQIAGMASAHFVVQKDVRGKRTRSTIRKLDFQERIEEIARMSAGEKITDATLKYAREMIKMSE